LLVLINPCYVIFQNSSFEPDCSDEMKPVVGMAFDTLVEVEEFYKTYAHQAGFAVHIGPQIKVLDQVENMRFYCMRQGFMSKKKSSVPSI
jgi:hypothetical protein